LENWLGSICWEGKSTFRKLHKRSNWFIGVFELENPEKIDFNEKDKISGGSGKWRAKCKQSQYSRSGYPLSDRRIGIRTGFTFSAGE
jgi:hypothetical protein